MTRSFSFGLIVLCEILLLLLWNLDINTAALSILSTLIVVVFISFCFSAIFTKATKLPLTKNYGISGVIGIVAGIFFYLWAKDNFEHFAHWIETYGKFILLGIIFICACLLFFYKGARAKSVSED